MTFNEYQHSTVKTTIGLATGETSLLYCTLGLLGEAGEVAEKIKKLWRNKGVKSGADVPVKDLPLLIAELGDVLWYLSALATAIGIQLDDIALGNLIKVQSRNARGVLCSEGDTR